MRQRTVGRVLLRYRGRLHARINARVSRRRGALTARGTRRQSVPGGSMAASMPPTVPQSARAPRQTVC
ncbi:UNVERIFIED_CONTAM: hypothetical protein EX528_11265 [Xanthomonas axonopodis]